jgi:hypothetical protein
MELRNESGLAFTDISSESWREYDFGATSVRLTEPIALNVSKSGGHRVLTADGISHYVPPGWKHLSWTAKEGRPHFVK